MNDEREDQQLYVELNAREHSGIAVSLLWSRATGDLVVRVVDGDDVLELPAAPQEAREVFEHPYAYAAFRGVTYAAVA